MLNFKMEVKELIKELEKLPKDAKVVLHKWNDEKGSSFLPLSLAGSQKREGELILIVSPF